MDNIKSAHSFSSRMREGIEIEGVLDVSSFDEGGVVMETVCGSLAVEGEGLHVTVLNVTEGRVVIEGRINGAYYFDNSPKPKRGLFGKKE
jgi:sporulation protein YabP